MAGILKVDRIQSDSNLAFAIAGSNVAFMNATSLQMTSSNISLAGTNVFTSGKLVTAGLPSGSVLQVVQGTYSTQTSTSSATYVTSGLEASITPSSSSSKILVTITQSIRVTPGQYVQLALYRGGTNIAEPYLGFGYIENTQTQTMTHAFNYLDSPATTSSTTYISYMSITSGGTVTAQVDGKIGTLTLLEIAA